jgi:outer membrane immunogenic protein
MHRLVVASLAAAGLSVGFSAAASAADLGYPAPAPVYTKAPIMAPWSWTGFYIGGNVGGAWSNNKADPGAFTTTGFVDFAGRQALGQFPSFGVGNSGFTGGGQIGYNFQIIPSWVAGVEADLNYVGINGSKTLSFPVGAFDANTQSASEKETWLGTVRGRLGVTTLNDRLLVYGTGGLAVGDVKNAVQTVGVPNGFPGVLVGVTSSSTRTGYTFGGGLEYAFTRNWSAKAEYLYYNLGTETLNLNYGVLAGGAGNAINYKFGETGNIGRVGLNYRFW